MTARFGNTDLPEQQARTLAKAIRLERISFVVTCGTIALVLLVAGSSQAMKAAWIEDALSLLPPLAFLIAERFIRRRPTAQKPYGHHRSVGIAHLVSAVALLVMGLYLFLDSAHGLVTLDHPPIGVMVVFGTPIWQGWLLFLLLGAWIDTRFVENALDRVGAGVKTELFQLANDALVAPQDVF